MPVLKTKNPELLKCKIISRPSDNCPYFLVKIEEVPDENKADIITDTAVFFSQYDLKMGEAK